MPMALELLPLATGRPQVSDTWSGGSAGAYPYAAVLPLLREQARALENAGRRREAGGVLLRAAALVRDKAVVASLQREAGAAMTEGQHLTLEAGIAHEREWIRYWRNLARH